MPENTQKNTNNLIAGGLFWRFAERFGAQSVNFIVSLILARLLTPEDYGTIALITIFIDISYVFIASGFGTALIQKKDADDLDFSTVFYFNMIVAVFCYIVLFFSAPFIADFYNNQELVSVIRVLALIMILGGYSGIQESIVSKTMQFKKFFISTSFGTTISAVVGITMAFCGCGVWALVGQQLSNQLINTIILRITVRWKVQRKFSFERLKVLYRYGWKLLVSSLIDAIYNNIYSLVIGKIYSSKLLGLYNKGQSFPRLIISNINTATGSVLFSAMSAEQDSKKTLKNMTKKSVRFSSFLIFPCMTGLAAISPALVELILTEKWLPCVPFIQFSCFTYAFYIIHTLNLQAMKALGYSGKYLKVEIIKKIIGFATLFATIPFGINVMLWAKCVTAIICWIINAEPNKKLIDYGWLEQFKDTLFVTLISAIMFVSVWLVGLININIVLTLLLQIIIGCLVYFSLALIFKNDSMLYTISLVKKNLNRKVKN